MLYPTHDRITAALGRRDFLRLSGIGSAVVASGCSAAGWLDAGALPGLLPQPPVFLDMRRFHVLAALAEGLYPGRDQRPGGLEIGVPQSIDRELYFAAPHLSTQVKQALDVLEYGGLFAGWWGRFSRLDVARRIEAVTQLLDHRWLVFRQVGQALSQLVKAYYYADART